MTDPADIAFDDDGAAVPSVDFEFPDDEGGPLEYAAVDSRLDLLALAVEGGDARTVGERILLMAYVAGMISVRDLARRIGKSKSEAYRRGQRFQQFLRERAKTRDTSR